ncbi:tau and MAP protein, tubulin-binding repeat domain-containing protein [Ditylenchus destructor]|uniref:Microtubule-associated protein n=1 Tax=Ditylenchus destructor TaxID=166010 RepID=A0AAD4MP95_9BILA|nr:tau and MAP protein, tubulin-binding repeat domain-containing protein [Ditylenchus destructor]
MRSSSVRPRPAQNDRHTESNHTSRQNHLNSTARSSSSTGGRSPSVPITPKINKKYVNVKPRIDANSEHTPQASRVKIFHQPLKFNVSSKIGSLQNASHVPGGGNVRIENRKINYKENAKPRIEDKVSVQIPKSEKKIMTQKLEWKAAPKIGSLQNFGHKPGGGDVQIFNKPVEINNVRSKVGSLDNVDHKPAGGNVKISEYSVNSAISGHRNSTSKDTSKTNSATTSRRSSSSAPHRQQVGTNNV